MSRDRNPLHSRLRSAAPDNDSPADSARVRQPNVKGSAKGAGNRHLLDAKADRRKARDRHRQAGERLVREIIAAAGLDADPVARMLSGGLVTLEELRGRLTEKLERGFFHAKTGDPKPAVKVLLDTITRQLTEARSLIGTLREMNEARRATDGEPVTEAYRCPSCNATWTVNGRAQRFVCVFDDGEVLGTDPSGLVGVYTDDATADAALAAQERAGRDDEPNEGDSTSADLSRPGALPHRPLSAIAEGIADTPTARKLERMRARYARRATNPTDPDAKGYRGEA